MHIKKKQENHIPNQLYKPREEQLSEEMPYRVIVSHDKTKR